MLMLQAAGVDVMASLPHPLPGILLFIAANLCTGFYIQPEVLFLSEHPESQQVVAGSGLSLSCSVQLRGLTEEDGGLNVPIVWWSFNNVSVSSVFPEAVESRNRSSHQFLKSTLHISHTSPNHMGTYHCNIEDGTDEGGLGRFPDLCKKHSCHPFITASHPAAVTVLENSMVDAVVEVQMCSSTLLHCGSLLPSPGLRPVLEWTWNGTSLNGSSDGYNILSNDDLALYHSTEGGMVGVFQCIARSDSNSATIATYTVNEGDGESSATSSWLVASPGSVVAEGDTLSLHLTSSGHCLPPQSSCVWFRNNSHICSDNSTSETQSNTRYSCHGRMLTVSSASHLLDTGRFCCGLESESEVNECIDVYIAVRAPPVLASPHNGTTLTINTSHSSQHTLSCSVKQPFTSHFWVYNGELLPEQSGEIVNVSALGVYQCFAGNQFGYSVATVRIVKAGLTNPPGLPQFYEIPRPDRLHRPAYVIWWHPPNYPSQLNTDIAYSLSTLYEPTIMRNTSTEVFIPFDSYVYLTVIVLDAETGEEMSEESPFLWYKFNDSKCRKQVYFPPQLSVNCNGGVALITWTNNPDNLEYYTSELYSANGPDPGLYYINVTCNLPDKSVFETGGVFSEEGYTVFDEELPIGTKCVFKGAATPATGDEPEICLDPATILYDDNSSCITTAYIQFENDSYVALEEDGSKLVCLSTRGYNFSAKIIATYEDNSIDVRSVEVSAVGEDVCVSVEIVDDKAVRAATSISLSLQTDDDRVITGPPVVVTVLDNDVAEVHFTEAEYRMIEGRSFEVCVETEADLQIYTQLNLTIDGIGREQLLLPGSFTLGPNMLRSCQVAGSQDNNAVDSNRIYTMMLQSHDSFIDVSSSETSLIIENDDVAEVHFTEAEYRMIEGRSFEVCVETKEDLRAFIQLNLIIDGNGKEQLSLPGSFMLGPNTLRLCKTAGSQDNDVVDNNRTYTMRLQSHNSFINVSSSETFVIIENDDAATVGFVETNYEMQAGELKDVCVEAVGKLQKSVSVSLSVREFETSVGTDAHDYVDLEKYEILTFFPNYTACVWLNASSAITETTLLRLQLSGGQDVNFENDTAFVTITPAPPDPGVTTDPLEPVASSVIVVSVLVPGILVLVICLVYVVLLRYYFNSSTSTRDVILHTKPFELKKDILEPREIHFGSVPTLFEEPLTISAGDTAGKVAGLNAASVSSAESELQLVLEPAFENEGEGEERERGSGLSPEVKTLHTAHRDTSEGNSPSDSVSNSSHHEYIASDSIIQYSYPPSVVGLSYGREPRQEAELSAANDRSVTSRLVEDNGTESLCLGSGSLGIGSGDLGMDFGMVGMDRDPVDVTSLEGQAMGHSMNLLNDADLSVFLAPVVDSGIGMDIDENRT